MITCKYWEIIVKKQEQVGWGKPGVNRNTARLNELIVGGR
jgi:hypothetical protein